MKLAVVGVTGLVGTVINEVLLEAGIQISEYIPVASPKSVGKPIDFGGKTYIIHSMEEAIEKRPDVAIFSAGGQTSLDYAPKFAAVGTFVIDNSSAWRMDPNKRLVVPEINADQIGPEDRIIANPNCSTIQLVMALAPLHKKYGIRRVVVSTYQSFTGTGVKAVDQYHAEKNGTPLPAEQMAYKYPIFENVIPHCDSFLDNGYTKEEMKVVNETKKILGDQNIRVTATAVRVPVHGGHSESVNISFLKPFDLGELRAILEATPGIILQDDPEKFHYPMPLHAKSKNEVFVGRIRRDDSEDNSLNMWIVADNLRKGAATNAVQIVEYLQKAKLIPQ